ncbi:MAG TPA: MmcQ/YjbR family DNA-binding protein [Niabella sp.]
MNIEDIRNYCLQHTAVEEGFPFGPDTIVFKVNGKIFLLMGLESDPLQFNVKCDPDKAIELREQHDAVLPGYHMNKKHWNTILVDGSVSNRLLKEWITESYNLVAKIRK